MYKIELMEWLALTVNKLPLSYAFHKFLESNCKCQRMLEDKLLSQNIYVKR